MSGPEAKELPTPAAASKPPLLSMVDASVRAPNGIEILKQARFQVAAGEAVAVVGPNGAGKSTLIRLVAGLAAPSTGEVRLGGRLLQSIRPAERARTIAYVGQLDAPDGRLTAGQYVALGLAPLSPPLPRIEAREVVGDALTRVGLAGMADRRLDRMSGGERQKAKVARAICQRPKLLVLDEPTNHLDPHARGALLGLLAEMNVAVVAALHDLTLIDAFADRVVMVEDGRVIAFAPPQDALSQERVRTVFGVDLFRLPHPQGGPSLAALDIMTRAADTSSARLAR